MCASIKVRLLLGIAIVHLSLAALSAAHLRPISDASPPGRAVYAYSEIAAVNNNFGFFAPAVASQVRVRFTLCDKGGHCSPDTLATGSDEVNLKLHTMYSFFMVSEAQDLLARSWAAQMLARHRDAETVMVEAEIFQLPTMIEYSAGRREEWMPFYHAVFARR
jgi:hypothetical protein